MNVFGDVRARRASLPFNQMMEFSVFGDVRARRASLPSNQMMEFSNGGFEPPQLNALHSSLRELNGAGPG